MFVLWDVCPWGLVLASAKSGPFQGWTTGYCISFSPHFMSNSSFQRRSSGVPQNLEDCVTRGHISIFETMFGGLKWGVSPVLGSCRGKTVVPDAGTQRKLRAHVQNVSWQVWRNEKGKNKMHSVFAYEAHFYRFMMHGSCSTCIRYSSFSSRVVLILMLPLLLTAKFRLVFPDTSLALGLVFSETLSLCIIWG